MDIPGLLQAVGAASGIIGAVLNTSPHTPTRLLSFKVWTLTNILLLAWSATIGALYAGSMYFVYLLISGIGIARNATEKPQAYLVRKWGLSCLLFGPCVSIYVYLVSIARSMQLRFLSRIYQLPVSALFIRWNRE